MANDNKIKKENELINLIKDLQSDPHQEKIKILIEIPDYIYFLIYKGVVPDMPSIWSSIINAIYLGELIE